MAVSGRPARACRHGRNRAVSGPGNHGRPWWFVVSACLPLILVPKLCLGMIYCETLFRHHSITKDARNRFRKGPFPNRVWEQGDGSSAVEQKLLRVDQRPQDVLVGGPDG